MSSTYRIICVSHDPALVLDHQSWNRPAEAIAALSEGVPGHPHCDLIIGRLSGDWIEFCCTAARSQSLHHGSSHRDDEWVSASWLRLLALSDPVKADRARLRSCWSHEVARALRAVLGLDDQEEVQQG